MSGVRAGPEPRADAMNLAPASTPASCEFGCVVRQPMTTAWKC